MNFTLKIAVIRLVLLVVYQPLLFVHRATSFCIWADRWLLVWVLCLHRRLDQCFCQRQRLWVPAYTRWACMVDCCCSALFYCMTLSVSFAKPKVIRYMPHRNTIQSIGKRSSTIFFRSVLYKASERVMGIFCVSIPQCNLNLHGYIEHLYSYRVHFGWRWQPTQIEI